jgi:hypothetical protein
MADVANLEEETTILNKENWEGFVKGAVLSFLIEHNLQSITVDDGAGKKGIIKRNSSGDFKVQITSNETL